MPSLETLATFFGVSALLALSPGPDNLFVLMQSAQRGWRAGMAVVVGLCLGLVGHTAAVALGLAAVLAASSTAFMVLKLSGAAYLLWLAWGAWHAAPESIVMAPPSGNGDETAKPELARLQSPGLAGIRRMVARGVVMNLTNPKVLIFFLAFLPQFTQPARGSVAAQIMVLGCVFMLAAFLVFSAIALFAGRFGAFLQRSSRAQVIVNRLAALVFIGLAVRLAVADR